MSLVFVGQGLLPGRTLSNSDSFWFKAPWGYAKPAALQRPSNPEFDDAPAVLHPFARFTKDNLPDVPLWNPHIMTGRPVRGRRAVGDLLAVQRARLSAAVLHGARLDRGAQAVGRLVRDVPARPRARHAVRGRDARRGLLRLLPVGGDVAVLSACERLGADPAAARGGRPRDPPAGRARRVAAGRADGRAAAVRATRSRASTPRSRRSCSARCASDRPARAVARGRCWRSPAPRPFGFALAAVAVAAVPRAADGARPTSTSGRARRRTTTRRSRTRSARSCPTGTAARRRRRCGCSCSRARGTAGRSR